MERRGDVATAQTLAEQAYQAIRRDIVRCDLEPGRQVTEAQMVERYGVGRATVRAALNRLCQERLVQALPREGYRVAPITLKQARDLLDARLLVEPPVARLAAGKIGGALLTHLTALCDARYAPGDRGSVEEFLRANTEFHVAIARATGNDRLVELVASLLGEMERLEHFGHLVADRNSEARHEHHEVVEALAAGDGPLAEQIMKDQILGVRAFLLDALLASPSLQTVNLAAV
jgi:DNA-binding GntR family transcriptional regulator